jgi:hypothetical protein
VDALGSRVLLRLWGVWAARVSFAAVFPGMPACRVPDCQVIQAGVCPRPGTQIEDIGGIRIVLAGVSAARPRQDDRRSAIGSAVRIADPIRHTAVDEDAGARQSRVALSRA